MPESKQARMRREGRMFASRTPAYRDGYPRLLGTQTQRV